MADFTAEERIALQDLLTAYSWALDTGDTEALVALFTPDCIMSEEVFEEPDIWHGHEGIRGLAHHYFNAPGFPGRQHHVTQSRFKRLADGRVESQSFAFITECQGEPPYTLRFAGWYDDIIVKSGDRWLFEKRLVRLWDGPVLSRFPGKGEWKPRKRPPELVIRNPQSQS
ncbi:MAG: nuclear transport factor 2 family protein [Spongiibacteraceae bacterium]|jgi:hypothetical protein|nr:nuclear transport factor 2 family protein [Spongiibacteraceae bacterium]